MTETTRASVLCVLCSASGTVETDSSKRESVTDALAWSTHFLVKHPEVSNGVSRFIVMTPISESESLTND